MPKYRRILQECRRNMPKYRRSTVFRNIGETCPNIGGI